MPKQSSLRRTNSKPCILADTCRGGGASWRGDEGDFWLFGTAQQPKQADFDFLITVKNSCSGFCTFGNQHQLALRRMLLLLLLEEATDFWWV